MHTPKGNLQLKLQPMDLNLLLQGQQLTRSLTFAQFCDTLEFPSETRAICLGTTDQLLPPFNIPNSTSSENHHLASYHRVRKAIAAKYISFHWKDGKSNRADILSKHWEFATVWPMLKPILFWRGETATHLKGVTGFRQPIHVQSHLEMSMILVQLSHSTHLETSSLE